MPTVMSHAVVALGLGKTFTGRKLPALFWITTAALAMLPDFDSLGFRLGISYESFLGHRGFSHSLLFAFFVSGAVSLLTYRHFTLNWKDLWGFFFVATASHGILDAFTNGGLGVAFFSPFDRTRYFFPWRPIEVSPIGVKGFLSERGAEVLWSEILWLWLPTGALVALVLLGRGLYDRWRQDVR